MTIPDPKVVESPVRLSCSTLWDIQKNYFQTMGVEAWDGQVPYYISSNMFIAVRYATVMIHAIQDWLTQHPAWRTETFYFLEIGAGTGKFSFYFLKAFHQLLHLYGLQELQYCYIISDVIEKNVEYCMKNESLGKWIEEGKLDFSVFNGVDDKDFFLKNKKQYYSALNVKTPLGIIANYILDCVQIDLFHHVPQKGFQEVHIGINSRYKNFNVSESRHLEDLKLEHHIVEKESKAYYEEPLLLLLNDLLQHCHERFKEEDFYLPMPVGAIRLLDHMSALTQDNYLILVGDKGVSCESDLLAINLKNVFSFDGCFSFLVNFYLLGEYTQRTGGAALLNEKGPIFNVVLFSKGHSIEQLKETTRYMATTLNSMGPKEYCDLYYEFWGHDYRFTAESLLAFLRVSEGDPDAYVVVCERLLELYPGLTVFQRRIVETLLKTVQENIYNTRIGQDFYYLLGLFYAHTDQDAIAIPLFERSIAVWGKQSGAYRSLGMIYEKRRQPSEAIVYFEKASQYDPKDHFSKKHAAILKGSPMYRWVLPFLKATLICAGIAISLYMLSFFA